MPPLIKGVIADIDTPSSRYQVVNAEHFGAPIRLLTMGPRGSQSGVYTNGSTDLVFDYTRAMADLVGRAPQRQDILILGGGAFTLPAYLADTYPTSHIDVVEIDPDLVAISREHFGYYDRPHVTLHTQDARAFLNTNHKQYDLILVDIYSDISIPFAVTTREYGQQLARATRDGGAVIANIIGADTAACGPLLRSIHASYTHSFAHHRVQPLDDPAMQTIQNIILVYSNSSLKWATPSAQSQLKASGRLTDNFAPVERLQQQCWDT